MFVQIKPKNTLASQSFLGVGVYLGNRFFYRLGEFLRHWYKDGFFVFFRWLVNLLERMDRYFAARITLRYLFQPLYQNYTFVGYVWDLFSAVSD